MFAICIEASHNKGMGHLFRMLNFARYLKKQNEKPIFFVNNNDHVKNILKENSLDFEIVDLEYSQTNWELQYIKKHNISHWINDRLDTKEQHALNIKNYKKDVKLITFDDLGIGAQYSDINICGLFFNNNQLKGNKIIKGVDYLILNKEIDKFKRERKDINNILVTLGGSDTYAVTIKILKFLIKYNVKANIHIGPSFDHKKELKKNITDQYKIITYVPSLIEEFYKYDLAITGGGVTPFEANASGLPCIIVANELFEIQNGKFLDKNQSSKFIGYYENIQESIFEQFNYLDINYMSIKGMNTLDTKAVNRIYEEIVNG